MTWVFFVNISLTTWIGGRTKFNHTRCLQELPICQKLGGRAMRQHAAGFEHHHLVCTLNVLRIVRDFKHANCTTGCKIMHESLELGMSCGI